MNLDQKHTPKYWVFHNTSSDDVLYKTMSKSFNVCIEITQTLYPEEFDNYYTNDVSPYVISLVEINLVKP